MDAEIPLRSWLDPRVAVRPSPIHGLGLFALAPLGLGEVVEVLGGSTLDDGEVRAMMERGERYDGLVLGPGRSLRIEPDDWPGIHGNHSCHPNLWMAGAVTVIARFEIPAGAELTVDYALYTVSEWWAMPCACGAALCHQVVTGSDWRLPELQARYGGHFVPEVARRIGSLSLGSCKMGT